MYLYGASGHGKVVFEIAEALGLPVEFFIDDNEALTELFQIPVMSVIPFDCTRGVLSIGNNHIRKAISQQLASHQFSTLVHPKANLSKRVTIADGTVVMAGVTINTGVQLGAHVIVNTNASIDHDCIIADFVHISPNVALCGGVTVGEGTHIGVGACVIPGVKIGKWTTVGAGTVVLHDVPDNAVIVGNPARRIR
jgi:sugar O-acyltransferase (sialic acid O-acetyltransferase NeuD family)